ncbi:MAG: AbrB/MazE/SpoVT family DNA-binding domain-containing protein [Rickettsiales bacterium]|jgi:antitoxin VapB|nr:AbrB/MazE/SpoVT family DNA-binding domain-containing protein [Rickettsiales bacterium]
MDVAKVFTTGRSQAVRLPKEFRFSSNEVYVRKHNGKVILSEKPNKTWAEIFKNFKGDPTFSVYRELIHDKPREIEL